MLFTAALFLLLLPAGASATFMTFSDRAAWEAAAAGAGLTVETEDFASDPGATFSVGGVDFGLLNGTYNAASEDLSPGFSLLELDFQGGDPLFGLGIQFSAGFGAVSGLPALNVSDGAQVASTGGSLGSLGNLFLGILSTEPLVPACTGCGSGSEIQLPVQFGSALMFADDLSVAVVPEPGTSALLAFGLAGLVAARRRSPRA
jgi:hypothetical protein